MKLLTYLLLSFMHYSIGYSEDKVGYRLFGKVTGNHKCASGMSNIWLSKNKLLLHQMEVPVGGQYEFFIKGDGIKNYKLKATHEKGCESDELELFIHPLSKKYYYEIKLK